MKKRIQWNKLNRKAHYWGALICALPILIVILSGVLLLLKKDISWIQPPTQRGAREVPDLSFEKVFLIVSEVPDSGVESWSDINRIDVRPGKGIMKVLTESRLEIQLDHVSGEVLHVAIRRSDLIESLHDGSFFHDGVKYWVFLPASLILLVLWITGIWLFVLPLLKKKQRKIRKAVTN